MAVLPVNNLCNHNAKTPTSNVVDRSGLYGIFDYGFGRYRRLVLVSFGRFRRIFSLCPYCFLRSFFFVFFRCLLLCLAFFSFASQATDELLCRLICPWLRNVSAYGIALPFQSVFREKHLTGLWEKYGKFSLLSITFLSSLSKKS